MCRVFVASLTLIERRIHRVCSAFVVSRLYNEACSLYVACLWRHAYRTKNIHYKHVCGLTLIERIIYIVCSAFVVSRLIACIVALFSLLFISVPYFNKDVF